MFTRTVERTHLLYPHTAAAWTPTSVSIVRTRIVLALIPSTPLIAAMASRPLLPLLNSSFPFTSPVLSLHTAIGAMSPSSLVEGDMHRTKSTRLTRVKELLTPIKASTSPVTPTSPANAGLLQGSVGADEGFIKADLATVGSQIEFFARHPEDSTNPLTFLDGSSGAGTGDTTIGTAAEELASGKEMQTMAQGESSESKTYATVFYSPPETDSHLPTGDRACENEGGSPPITILKAPRKYTGDGRRQPRFLKGEEIILIARPVTLHEFHGRFRSKEPCWYCCDGVVGTRCGVCGLVVRSVSPETWG